MLGGASQIVSCNFDSRNVSGYETVTGGGHRVMKGARRQRDRRGGEKRNIEIETTHHEKEEDEHRNNNGAGGDGLLLCVGDRCAVVDDAGAVVLGAVNE